MHERPRWHQRARRRLASADPLVWLLLASLVLSAATLAVVVRVAAVSGAL